MNKQQPLTPEESTYAALRDELDELLARAAEVAEAMQRIEQGFIDRTLREWTEE